MKKTFLIIIMIIIMIPAGCSASDNNTPDANISATEQPEARTTGLLPEGEICNITAKTLPEGLEYTFSDSTSIQNIREYFDSLTLESDFPENPETYNGMTWVLKFTFSDQSEETIYHFGNMFVKNEKSQWFKMKYKEAEKLDGILADIEIFQISPSDNKVGEFLDKIGEVTHAYDGEQCYNITPISISEKYGFDVFKYDKSCASYLMYNGEIYTLGSCFGGYGIVAFAVADINKDGTKELYFTYSWGSGIHRSQVGYFDPTAKEVLCFVEPNYNFDMAFYVDNGMLMVCDAEVQADSFVNIKTFNLTKAGEIKYVNNRILFSSTGKDDSVTPYDLFTDFEGTDDEVAEIAEKFATAYILGDTKTIKEYLAFEKTSEDEVNETIAGGWEYCQDKIKAFLGMDKYEFKPSQMDGILGTKVIGGKSFEKKAIVIDRDETFTDGKDWDNYQAFTLVFTGSLADYINQYRINVLVAKKNSDYKVIHMRVMNDDIDNNYDAMMEAYTGIAQKYFDVQAAIIENGIDYYTENLEEGLNRLYFGAPGTVYAEDKQTILLYDINNDGILEFFIARLHHGESKNTVYAGYTWKDGELCQLMPGVEIGYRSGTIDIRADGKVLSFFSGSAWDYGVEVYSLPKNGTDLIREEKAYASRVDGDGYGNSYSRYYKKTEGQDPVEISEVEYEQFISGFKEIPLNFIDNTPEVLEALRK